MKSSNKFKAAALAALTMAGGAMAHAITIETVTVGNINNAADFATLGLHGAVTYSYQIGKYEVTNTQYVAFLNAKAVTDTFGLYNTSMESSALGGITRAGTSGSFTYAVKSLVFTNKPVNFVSFWDATRFTNWVNNGQGSADTETGSYTLGSVTNPVNGSVTRNGGANWVMASENEWYKAAYYDPNWGGPGFGDYWQRANRSNTLGNNTTGSNGANYDDGDFANGGLSGPGTTDVGAYTNAASFYGTFDQGGNLWEWNETISGINRRLRGGSLINQALDLRSSYWVDVAATAESPAFGFRVASLAPIPEPSTYGAVMGAMALGIVMMRRRRARGTL